MVNIGGKIKTQTSVFEISFWGNTAARFTVLDFWPLYR